MVSLLAYSAQDVDTAGIAVDARLPLAWLAAELTDASLEGKEPGHVTGRLSRTGNDIVVRARVQAALTTPCARCLKPAAIDIDTELSLLLHPVAPAPRAPAPGGKPGKPGKQANGSGDKPTKKSAKPNGKLVEDEYEFSAAEADADTYDGETVVLDPFVREAILLEVPNFPLCSEGCTGISPPPPSSTEEAGRPTLDPRLAPLLALRSKLANAGAPAPAPPALTRKRSASIPKPTTETKATLKSSHAVPVKARRKAEPPKKKQNKE